MARKDQMLQVRLTAADQVRAQQLAALTGGNVSDLVRTLLRDAKVIVRPAIIEAESVQVQEMSLA